jgi:hypothetical protein
MTKNTKFNDIKLAMKAGHYENLTLREKKIYKNAFKMAIDYLNLTSRKNRKFIYLKKL